MNRNEKLKIWAAGWLEKMSIVTIFNGLFSGSGWSFWLGIACALGSAYLSLIDKEEKK